MGKAFEAYQTRRALYPALLLFYFFVAITATQARGEELYPFFNWSLFSAASNPKADTVLIIRSVDGVPLPKPTLFYDMPRRFSAAKAGDSRLAKTLDRLRWAANQGDAAKERRLRAVVERTFMAEADRAEYDLAVLVYDPIDRLKTGTIQQTHVIRSYRKGAP